MEVEIHATTGIGPIRRGNEDDYLVLNLSDSAFLTKPKGLNEFLIQSERFEVNKNDVILAVSDGCGGRFGGEVASAMSVEIIRNMLTDKIPNLENSFFEKELVEQLYHATIYANGRIYYECRINPDFNNSGCTLTATAISPKTVDFVQVGDSRGYLIREGKIHQITKDQSLANKLVDLGEISPEEAEIHPFKHAILQALGAQNEIYPDVTRLIPKRDDILLLCSDGLSNEVKNEELLQIIAENLDDLKNACKMLIQKASEHGGRDNITVILAKILGDDLSKPTEDSVEFYQLDFGNSASDTFSNSFI